MTVAAYIEARGSDDSGGGDDRKSSGSGSCVVQVASRNSKRN